MIIWIMGLSGSGKTTLAKLILKKYKKKLIHIDGDAIRNIYDKKIGHSQKDRQINAARISLNGSGVHKVSLDDVMKTMMETGKDMQNIYKETSQGGLAVNVTEC